MGSAGPPGAVLWCARSHICRPTNTSSLPSSHFCSPCLLKWSLQASRVSPLLCRVETSFLLGRFRRSLSRLCVRVRAREYQGRPTISALLPPLSGAPLHRNAERKRVRHCVTQTMPRLQWKGGRSPKGREVLNSAPRHSPRCGLPPPQRRRRPPQFDWRSCYDTGSSVSGGPSFLACSLLAAHRYQTVSTGTKRCCPERLRGVSLVLAYAKATDMRL